MADKRRTIHPIEDQVTRKYKTASVPEPLTDGETTTPVDVREIELAARGCRPAPTVCARVIPRAASGSGQAGQPRAGLQARVHVAGTAQKLTLPVRNISPTGVSLEVPQASSLVLREGIAVTVRLMLSPTATSSPTTPPLRAVVAHYRAGTSTKPGGTALRWDLHGTAAKVALERVLVAINAK